MYIHVIIIIKKGEVSSLVLGVNQNALGVVVVGSGGRFKFGSPFSSTHSFVFSVPMVLLAFNSTICCIPTTIINGLCFAI